MDGTVLIAEDDAAVRKVLSQALTRAGCRVHATSLLTTLNRWVNEGKGDLVISDVAMPDGNGLEQLLELRKIRPELPFIVISAQNTITTAIRAEEAAAFAYLPKPFDLPALLSQVKAALKRGRPAPAPGGLDGETLPLVGRTPAMQSLYHQIAKVINAELSLHLIGESGTGKSLIAKVIHELGDRRGLPLITTGASDIASPEQLVAVFARSRGGTIVLDEIADFGGDLQKSLVRVLDSHAQPAPRIISTSQYSLDDQDRQQVVRPDLYYRLCEIPVAVPPLRLRIDDIPLLAEHFLPTAERGSNAGKHFAASACDMLKSYSWPGNLRQLRSVVQRLALVSSAPEISAPDVKAVMDLYPQRERQAYLSRDRIFSDQLAEQIRRYFNIFGDDLPPAGIHARVLREVEKPLIEAALDATGGNKFRCAEMLGINRNTLRKKINHLGISGKRRKRLS